MRLRGDNGGVQNVGSNTIDLLEVETTRIMAKRKRKKILKFFHEMSNSHRRTYLVTIKVNFKREESFKEGLI